MSALVLARTSRAEWTRIWTLRSTWWLVLATAVLVLGVGALIGAETTGEAGGPSPGTSAWEVAQVTSLFAVFGISTLAVLAATGDYGTGGIIPTLQWTPRRGTLLTARVGVITLTTAVLGVVLASLAGVLVRVFAPELGLPLVEGLQTRAWLLYLFATCAALAVGLGLLLRNTAGALVSVIALLLVLPILLGNLPFDAARDIALRLPGTSAVFLISGGESGADLTLTSARLTLAAWAVAACCSGGTRLLRSDASR